MKFSTVFAACALALGVQSIEIAIESECAPCSCELTMDQKKNLMAAQISAQDVDDIAIDSACVNCFAQIGAECAPCSCELSMEEKKALMD